MRLLALAAAVLLVTGAAWSLHNAQGRPLAELAAVRVAPAVVGPPTSIAALGDSFNTGFAARPAGGDAPSLSWSTGTDPRVASIYARLAARTPAIRGHAYLLARDGSKIASLARQVERAADLGAALITVQSGGNDLCAARDPDQVTPPAAFRASVEQAFAALRSRLPDARILVTSITDEARWNDASLRAGNAGALKDGSLCDPRPDGDGAQDRARRAQIQRAERTYDAILDSACRADPHCRYDGGAFFRLSYRTVDISPYNAFHPSTVGLARLAATAWKAGFDFADVTAPRVTAAVTRAGAGLRVALAARDAAGIAGIEYGLGNEPYRTYAEPLSLAPGTRVRFRAVDRNGNASATYAVSAPAVRG